MKHLLSASAMLLFVMAASCGGGNKTVDTSAVDDSMIAIENESAQQLSDSLAKTDSLAALDSVRFNKAVASDNINTLIDEYDIQCLAVYEEFGSDGMPLGEQPRVLKQALELRKRLRPMENRMSTSQKELYDSLTGYIRRFL